jgi:membrane protein insertase Oxa1/YidC/SpoIIIJ
MLFDLFNWFQNLEGFELMLWSIALFFSLFFVLQTIVSLFTGGDHIDSDFDGDGEIGYQFFTIKNMIAFFTMFGWAGLAAYKGNLNNSLVVVIALLSGCSMVFLMYLLMRNTSRLKHSGTLQMKNAINQIGETYLRIPAQRGGLGKVQVQVQGRYMELDAMTDDTADIATGRPIQVVNILNNQILLVTSNLVA